MALKDDGHEQREQSEKAEQRAKGAAQIVAKRGPALGLAADRTGKPTRVGCQRRDKSRDSH